MIYASKFYSAFGESGFGTLIRVAKHLTGNNSKNTITLPPGSGNIDQDSDAIYIPDNCDNYDAIFEPAGDLEVDGFGNS